MTNCYCGSAKDFSTCCEPLIAGQALPETAEALMRSRYVAYCIGAIDYLVETTLPRQQALLDQKGIRAWSASAEWLGLRVESCEAGTPDDDIGYVQFTARFKQAGQEQEHNERSCFRKIGKRWYYDDGMPVPVETFRSTKPKVGRNEPCPCGSGRKYKKCCGA